MDECHRCVNYECRDPREPGTPGDLCCYSGEGVQQCARWQADRAVAAEKRLAEALAILQDETMWCTGSGEYPPTESSRQKVLVLLLGPDSAPPAAAGVEITRSTTTYIAGANDFGESCWG